MGRTDRVEQLEGVLSLLILGAGFLALFAGFEYFFLIWIIGFAVLLPIVAILFDTDDEDEAEDSVSKSIDSAFEAIGSALSDVDEAFHEHVEPTFENRKRQREQERERDRREAGRDGIRGPGSTADALDVLRDRYARGDLTDEQFERKLDRLLGTTTPENAEEWRDARRKRERELERER